MPVDAYDSPMPPRTPDFDVLILAGGAARRLGGVDKPMLEIGGSTLLDRVIEACAASTTGHVIVVGPPRATRRDVHWTSEDPPGGGPAAAIAAGLAALDELAPVSSGPSDAAPLLAVFAADLPLLDAKVIHSLWTTLSDTDSAPASGIAAAHDGTVIVDADGREQWLAAIYRRDALAAQIAKQPPERISGLPLRRLVQDLRLLRVLDAGRAVVDCDTWEDVAAARRIAASTADRTRSLEEVRPMAPTLDSWLHEAAQELGRPELALSAQQQAALLDLARVAAHSIDRPAAPLTTFAAGYALGIGGSLDALGSVVSALSAAAESHKSGEDA